MAPADGSVILTTASRPDLAPTIALWLWRAFWRDDGYTLEQVEALTEQTASTDRLGAPQTFVFLENGEPVGTASLAVDDLDERPHLTPWLAGVFVTPAARKRGIAMRLIAAVEHAARSVAIETLWLYTNTAEGLYARAGWHAVETVCRDGKPSVTLMRRDLSGAAKR